MLGAMMYFLIWLPLQVARYCWLNWKIEGLEHLPPRGQGMVLATNHLHWLDILIIGASLPLSHRPSWIAKSEIFSNRLFTWWLYQMLVIPIRRGQRDVAALGAAEEALERGVVLIIFPEGHRSRGGELQEGRSGAVRLAMRSGCPIVPIAIWGTEVGVKGVLLRKPIRFSIGKPYIVSTEGEKSALNRTSVQTEELMLRIAEMMPEAYWGFYRERMLQDGGQAIEAGRSATTGAKAS